MKYQLPLFLLFFLSSYFSFGQSLEEFGELNPTNTSLYNSASTSAGIVYFINELPSNKLVQVDWSGKIIREVILPFTDSLYYTGQLISEGDQIYLLGVQRLYPNDQGTNDLAIWNSQRRSLIAFNADLSIAETYFFEVVPFGAGEIVRTAGTYAGTFYPSSLSIKDNELSALWSYSIFDTQATPPTVIGTVYQYERIDLSTKQIFVQAIQDITFNLDAIYLANDFYVYGEVSDTIINGTSFNSRPVGRFNRQGEKIDLYSFDGNFSGGLSDGCLGTLYDNKIYSTYYGRSVADEGCEADNTVVDVRDTDFNLIQRVKLPDCGLFPFSKDAFAFTSTGDFYFSALNADSLHLYRFDADLHVLCSEAFYLPEETPVSLKITPDDEVILETLYAFEVLRLYRFSCEKGTATLTTSIDLLAESTFFPNPTSGMLYLDAEVEGLVYVEAYSMAGARVFQDQVRGDAIDLSGLPAGVYWVRGLEERAGGVVAQGRVVRD